MRHKKPIIQAKKGHTVKAMVISSDDKRIRYLSEAQVGKTHDYTLLKYEFPPENDLFSQLTVRIDLGYQGFAANYVCKKVVIPHKENKNQE